MAKNFLEVRKKMSPEARARPRALAEEEAEVLSRSFSRDDVDAEPREDKPTTEN